MLGPRLPLAAALLLVASALSPARAEDLRTVVLETTPAGAAVYLGDKDGEPIATTPARVKLPPGEHLLIVVLDGYLDAVVPAVVPAASGRAARKPVELDPVLMQAADATLEVRGEAPDGAVVVVDGEPKGELPLRLEVAPGPHQIQVLDGERALWDEWVEIDSGAEHVVTVSARPEVEVPIDAPPSARPPRPPVVVARVGPDFGWRDLAYDQPGDAANTPSFSSRGLAAVRVEVELAPWRWSAQARPLWPLTLVVGGGYAAADRVVSGSNQTDQFWRTTEVGLRYRYRLHRHVSLGADAGWARLLWAFRGDQEEALPDADYQTVRLGLRGEGHVGPFTAWLTLDNRVVASGGSWPDRFRAADADGLGLRSGLAARLWRGRLEAGLEYALTSFGWSFQFETGDTYRARGATDRFDSLRVWVGGAY